jgi:hypothetical protein
VRVWNTSVKTALACRIHFHSDNRVKCRRFLAPETFPLGTASRSGSPYMLLFGAGQLGRLGDVGVGCWASVHSLLHETEKQFAPTFGFASVKAKRELIEVIRQMLM